MSDKTSVLFVCVHNAGRSQMAAAFLQSLGGDGVEVRSAGTAPTDRVNPVVVDAMHEVGIDVSAATPKVLTTDAVQASDVVITMGCGDECPLLPRQALPGLGARGPGGRPGHRRRASHPRGDPPPCGGVARRDCAADRPVVTEPALVVRRARPAATRSCRRWTSRRTPRSCRRPTGRFEHQPFRSTTSPDDVLVAEVDGDICGYVVLRRRGGFRRTHTSCRSSGSLSTPTGSAGASGAPSSRLPSPKPVDVVRDA